MTDILQTITKPSQKFDLFSGILKAAGGDGEPMTLSGTASSTVEDLHGDNIQRSGLKDMAKAIEGMTIFRNHSYQVPGDIMGTALGGKVVKRGEDSDGNAVWDFDIDMVVNEANPAAVETWTAIKSGTKLGFSIGANIPAGGAEVDRKTGAKTISRINLLETSIVGIPANPRSWIARALESIQEADGPTDDVTVLSVSPEEVLDAPPADDRDDIVAEAEPVAGPDDNGSSPSDADSDPDPAIVDDASSTAEGDTPLEGEADLGLAAIESLDEADIAAQFGSTVELLAKVVGDLKVANRERDEALRAKEAAERERDEAVQKATEAITATGAVITQLKQTPLGRKTAVRESEKDLAVVERWYGPEMAKMMENSHSV